MSPMNIQLRVVHRCILMEGTVQPGDVLWVSPERARHLLENGICAYVGEQEPHEQPEAGPGEAKPAGPSEVKKKPSAGLTAGRLTGLQSSKERGLAKHVSASAAALVSPERR